MLTHDAAEELLGAYAVDAVDPDERVAIERHVAGCERCQQELRQHHGALAALVSDRPAPPPMWERIAAQLDPDPESRRERVPAVVPLERRRERRRAALSSRAAAAVAAVAAAVAVVLGVQVVRQADRLDQLEAAVEAGALAELYAAVLDDPAARVAELRSAEGALLARAALRPDGTGFLAAESLPPLAPARTYQLWGATDGGVVSLGVLGPRPQVVAFTTAPGTAALVVTEEREGGVAVAEGPKVAEGEVAASA